MGAPLRYLSASGTGSGWPAGAGAATFPGAHGLDWGHVTVPAWVWAVSAVALAAVIAAEIMLTARDSRDSFTTRSAVTWIVTYVSLAVAFGLAAGIEAGWTTAGQFYAGYLTEYSLSVDNLFIFYLIMGWFAVPAARQRRVLLLGIGLALVLRSALIVTGAAFLNRFSWLFYPLAGVLVWTAASLIAGRQDGAGQHARLLSWLRRRLSGREEHLRRPTGTPVLLLAAAIGLADVLFAVDSIPAVFGITASAPLVVACNVFALMGLRQLYVVLARVLDRIIYLNKGLGIICGFIGVKLLLHALHTAGAGWAPEIPAWLSLTVVAGVLAATVLAGTVPGRRAGEQAALERRFGLLDVDGNGIWQRDHYQLLTRRLCQAFGQAVESAAGQAVAAGQRALFDALLPHMDADGDQEITKDEFLAAAGRTIDNRPGFDAAVRSVARSLVQLADQDGNGAIDPGEYRRLAAVYGARDHEAARAFGRLDQDRNGLLDTAELAAAISRFFCQRPVALP